MSQAIDSSAATAAAATAEAEGTAFHPAGGLPAAVTGAGLPSPGACGLGGDAFVVLYNAAEGRPYAVNGSGVAPGATSRERFTSRGLTTMPLSGLDSVSVPGAPDAYWTVHQRFGS